MADTANTPEVRMSPDGLDVVIRNTGHPAYPWRSTRGLWHSNEEVAGWTPLVPASHRTAVNHNSGNVTGTLLQIGNLGGQVRRG